MFENSWIVLTILSAILFGMKDILVKKLLPKSNLTGKDVVYSEYILIFFTVAIFLYPLVDFSSLPSLWLLYIFNAIAMGTGTLLYLNMLEEYEISLVSPLINLSPFVLLFLSAIFLSESMTLVQFTGILIIIAATYFLETAVHHRRVESPHKHHLRELFRKDYKFFGLVTLLLFAFSFAAITNKMILSEVNVFTNLFFVSIIIAVSLTLFNIKKRSLFKIVKNFRKEPWILSISVLTIISNFLVLSAIAIPAAMVSLIVPLRRTSTLFSSFFGGLLFHESHLGKKLIATVAMLIGIVFIVL